MSIEVDFSKVSETELKEMQEAGHNVINCHRILAKTNDNIVGELLRDHEEFFEWDHYPDGDVYDFENHGQYYYHAHPKEERPGEHGHFHTFLRPDGMPPGATPAVVGGFAMPEDPDDALSHLAAISMDPKGFPIKLFTTNRWVTGEVWYEARDVCRFSHRFEIDLAHPSWIVNVWVTNMVTLFRPQIRELIYQRDIVVHRRKEAFPDRDVFEGREFEVVTECDVDLDAQMSAIEAVLSAR